MDLSKFTQSGAQLDKTAKKKKHKSNPVARRRLRSCIIAVYFSIFLQSYSRKIYQNKLKQFMTLYPLEVSKYYDKKDQVSRFKHDESKMWLLMENSMNLMKEVENNNLGDCLKNAEALKQVKVHFKFLLHDIRSSTNSDKEIKDTNSYEHQLVSSSNVEFLMGELVTITTKMCDSFMEIIQTTNFVEKYWKTIAQGLLNGSFINNSRPKLLSRVVNSGIVRCHPTH